MSDFASSVGPSWLTRYLSQYTDFPMEEPEEKPVPSLGLLAGAAAAGPGRQGFNPDTALPFTGQGDPPPVKPWGIPPAISIAQPTVEERVAEELKAAAPAAAPAAKPTRALRMPNGKIVFTNRPELGGPELNYGDATREVRTNTLAETEAAPYRSRLSDLVRSAAVQAQRNGETSPYHAPTVANADGPAPSFSGAEAAVSNITGTEDQQRQLQFDRAMQAASVARAQGDLEYEKMSPQQKADLGNPRIQAMGFLRSMFQKDFDMVEAGTEAAKKSITLPPGEERDKALAALEATRLQKREDLMRLMLGLLGENYRQ